MRPTEHRAAHDASNPQNVIQHTSAPSLMRAMIKIQAAGLVAYVLMAACATTGEFVEAVECEPVVLPDIPENATFTAFDPAPEPLNEREVLAALRRAYGRRPARSLRAIVQVKLNTSGEPIQICLFAGSGEGAFDSAAVQAAGLMRFRPARVRGEPAAATVRVPLSISVRSPEP